MSNDYYIELLLHRKLCVKFFKIKIMILDYDFNLKSYYTYYFACNRSCALVISPLLLLTFFLEFSFVVIQYNSLHPLFFPEWYNSFLSFLTKTAE